MVKKIIFGGGCFWCFEAVFNRVDGVIEVIPGYSGGKSINPTYESIHMGQKNGSKHAETIMIIYDENKIRLNELLEIFFMMHDPTTINRQGNDIGEEYRSIILFQNSSEEKIVKGFIKKIQKNYKNKIITEVKKLEKFYEAEQWHKDFYEKNKLNPYCIFVIHPKIKKFEKEFSNRIKPSSR